MSSSLGDESSERTYDVFSVSTYGVYTQPMANKQIILHSCLYVWFHSSPGIKRGYDTNILGPIQKLDWRCPSWPCVAPTDLMVMARSSALVSRASRQVWPVMDKIGEGRFPKNIFGKRVPLMSQSYDLLASALGEKLLLVESVKVGGIRRTSSLRLFWFTGRLWAKTWWSFKAGQYVLRR